MTARYARSILLPVLLLVAPACDSPTRFDRAMLDEQVWAGAQLSIRDVEAGPDTIFHFGDLPLPIVASYPGWVILQIPRDVEGSKDLMRRGSYNERYGRIDVLGFTDSIFHSVGWLGDPMRWPATGPASFIALDQRNSRISMFELASGTVTTLFEHACCFRAPGLTPDPDVLLFSMASGDSTFAWRMRPTRELVAKYRPTYGRQLIVMNDSVTVELHQRLITGRAGDRVGYLAPHPYVAEGFLSPRGDRVAMRAFGPGSLPGGGGTIDGIPVIGESGDSAFIIREVEFIFGVAFSPTGDTLYVAGAPTRTDTTTRIIARNAGTGAVHRTLDYPGYMPLDMTIDRTGRWLLIAMMTGYWGSRDGGGAHVLVVDRKSMTVAGHMEAPMDWQCTTCAVTIADGDDGIFLAIKPHTGAGMIVYRFRTPSDTD